MSLPPHEMLLRANWRRYFDSSVLARGLAYVRAGQVRALELRQKGAELEILASVQGSERKPYRCAVQLEDIGGTVVLESDCSCPVGYDCEHVAAVLAAAENRPAAEPDALHAWEGWLRRVDARPSPPVAPSAEPDRILGLLLLPSSERPPQLLVQAAWLRPLRSGQLGDPRSLQLGPQGPVPMPAGGWSDPALADRLVTLLAGGATWVGARSFTRIGSAHQERALSALLETLPAFWHKPGGAMLRPGPWRELRLRWADDGSGVQRLRAEVADRPSAEVLGGVGLWYVDPGSGEIGGLDGDRELPAVLASAPAVPPEAVEPVRRRLAGHPRLGRAAGLLEATAVERLDVEPRPVLRLRSLRYRRWRGPEQRCGCARLFFDYGPCRLPATGSRRERRRVGERVLDIERHAGLETAAREALERLRLTEAALVSSAVQAAAPGFGSDDYVIERSRGEPASPEHWLPLLPRLAAAGFALEFEPDFPLRLTAAPDAWRAELQPAEDGRWFDLSLGIEVEGQRVDLLPILHRLIADPHFPLRPQPHEAPDAAWLLPLDERRHVPLPLARLRGLIQPLLEWLEGPPLSGRLRLARTQTAVVDELQERAGLLRSGGEELRAQLQRLVGREAEAAAPPGFGATLRPYQRRGLAWLDFLAEAGLGGVLADDMGLGKTVQVLAHLLAEQQRGQLDAPALIVCPTSLVGNWRAEAGRFAPQLRVLVLHGAARSAQFANIAEHDLVITTYPLLPRDREALLRQRYSLLVLDEAQQIKNARTKAAAVVRELPARRRLAMTGTPLENHLGELWAQFDAVEPGLLGDEKRFTRHYRTPIEKTGDVQARARLNRRIAPLLLRRRKEDVLAELPPKTEIQRRIELQGRQRELYESLRLTQHQRVREAVERRGLAASGIVVLDALLKLRQACCDPRLVKLAAARRVAESAKLELLLEMLANLATENRRVLVFSQFAEMLALIAAELDSRRLEYLMLTGQTRRRAELVKRFQDGEAPVFLISLKAGGVGLNLTAADTVIHYDPWWNPAAEAQATDRAHRIGQDKPVFVYRLICAGTVEEKIQALQARKAELARAVLEGGGASDQLRFDEADLEALFAPL